MSSVMDIIQLVSDVITCIGVIIAIFEFRQSKKIEIILNDRQVKQNTLDAFKMREDEFHEYNSIIYKAYGKKIISNEELSANKEMEVLVKDCFNKLEFLCTGVNIGIYDIDVLERLYGDVMVRIYYQFYDNIRYSREDRKTEIVYAEFESTVKKMEKIQQRKELVIRNAEYKMKL